MRMSRPVEPGQTLRTEMWREAGDRVVFSTSVAETGQQCLTGGWVRLGSAESK